MKKPVGKILRNVRRALGSAEATIKHPNPFQVLISTVLSQRTRDENTERASELLFSRYSTAKQLSAAPLKRIEPLIRGTGFYKVKARHVKGISKLLIDRHNGKVPDSLEELIHLPGVGRKTANCVLVYAYQKPAIPVDTHVHRISNRIGFVRTKTPEKTETELIRIIPKREWLEFNDLFVKFGQRICRPIKPLCWKCPIAKWCDYPNKTPKPK